MRDRKKLPWPRCEHTQCHSPNSQEHTVWSFVARLRDRPQNCCWTEVNFVWHCTWHRFKAHGHHFKQAICSFISQNVVPICTVTKRFCISLNYIAFQTTGLSSALDSFGISSTLFRVVRVVRVLPGTRSWSSEVRFLVVILYNMHLRIYNIYKYLYGSFLLGLPPLKQELYCTWKKLRVCLFLMKSKNKVLMSQAQNNFFLWGAWRGKGRLARTTSCCFAVGSNSWSI